MRCGNCTISYDALSRRQEKRLIRGLLPGFVRNIWHCDTVCGRDVADFFTQEFALLASTQPRDWRKLAGRLGGSYRGFNADTLQALLPTMAPTARKEIEFEDLAWKLSSNTFASYQVESLGEFDAVASPGHAHAGQRCI